MINKYILAIEFYLKYGNVGTDFEYLYKNTPTGAQLDKANSFAILDYGQSTDDCQIAKEIVIKHWRRQERE